MLARVISNSADGCHRQDPEEAAKDFRDRIRNYEKVYQTIDESERQLTYVKIINIGYGTAAESIRSCQESESLMKHARTRVVINLIQDYLQSRLVYYLTNLHIKPRSIWLSRVRFPLCPSSSLTFSTNGFTAH